MPWKHKTADTRQRVRENQRRSRAPREELMRHPLQGLLLLLDLARKAADIVPQSEEQFVATPTHCLRQYKNLPGARPRRRYDNVPNRLRWLPALLHFGLRPLKMPLLGVQPVLAAIREYIRINIQI
ncbi:hypothetical protein NKR19_g7623 [Coniochaeta hoffmannii]|uniref:Uncharacterized protein n=1 Tax=Coniochaeta hoffmannii TaxID=91930 RepID=A0AA38VQ00_9PEZI|nr:hypothetical protein NKR19_g7623 [Coniochaeta hoffmannii]